MNRLVDSFKSKGGVKNHPGGGRTFFKYLSSKIDPANAIVDPKWRLTWQDFFKPKTVIKNNNGYVLYEGRGNLKEVLKQAVEYRYKGDISNVNLEGANLENINLKYAILANANLKNVNFKNAKISNINFENANLEGANFEGAVFSNVKFDGAKLNGANFKDMKQFGVCINVANLEDAIIDKPKVDAVDVKKVLKQRGR